MKKTGILLLLLLGGCQTHVAQYQADMAAQQDLLAQAQAEVDKESPKCSQGRPLNSLPPKDYLGSVQCLNALVEAKIVPLTPYPAPLQKFLYTNLENAALYSQGKISYEQVQARGKLAALAMQTEKDRLHNATLQQLSEQDDRDLKNLGASMQGLVPPRPVYTSCSTFGRTIECQTQ